MAQAAANLVAGVARLPASVKTRRRASRGLRYGWSMRCAWRHLGLALLAMAGACSGDSEPALAIDFECQPTATIDFPPTQVGQQADAVLMARNDDHAGTVVAALDGPDADQFTIDPISTCDGRRLTAGDRCLVRISHTPSRAGAHVATLRIGSTATPLTGISTATTTGLLVTSARLGFARGAVALGPTDVLITNQGTTPITLGSPIFAGDGFLGSTAGACGPTLTQGGACRLQVAITQLRNGCVAGTLTIPSSVGDVTVPVTTRLTRGVDVAFSGTGAARVTSDPPGIDCTTNGGVCGWLFDEDTVNLTAAGEGGTRVVSVPTPWAPELTPLAPVYHAIVALAPPDAKTLVVTHEGAGAGMLIGSGTVTATPCTEATCVFYAPPNSTASIVALAPSRFVGWSGACIGQARVCNLGLIVNDRIAAATFARDDREVTTLLPGYEFPADAVAATRDGDLLAAGRSRDGTVTSLRVTRLGLDGTRRWHVSLVENDPFLAIGDLTTIGSDAIYVASFHRLWKLTAAGTVAWTVPLPVGLATSAGFAARLLAVGDDVLVATADHVERRAASDGHVVWTVPAPGAIAVAARADGEIAIAHAETPLALTIERVALDGTTRGPPWSVAVPGAATSLTYDAGGALVVGASGALLRLDATGAVVATTDAEAGRPIGIATTATGRVVAIHGHLYRSHYDFEAGLRVDALDDAVGVVWSLDKPVDNPSDYETGWFNGVEVTDLAVDATGRAIVAGRFNTRRTWIEVLAPP
ncbi:MAG: hypothetical protein IPL61_05400 [Myxococcales bacterium]|nr:hypothetical protein [Myxococcales bacterium]